ncbi:MAG TPA: APC family permease [Bacteroidota bacterium]|nr:APC family permease [Bacteroidota bacterium]
MNSKGLSTSPAKGGAIRKLIGPIQLAAIFFFNVSGGPFGLEPVFKSLGNASLIAIIVVPIIWCLPTILMVFELNSALPFEGGYYQWVKRALGTKWGFFEGWWSLLYALTDLALYPVLFVQYLRFFIPAIAPFQFEISLAMIWICALINILGITSASDTSAFLSALIAGGFIVLFALGLRSSVSAAAMPTPDLHFAPVGLAMFAIMWNFLGWDNVTTIVQEVRQPVKTFFVSIAIAFAAILFLYLIASWSALHSGVDADELVNAGFPSVGLAIGGKALGSLISIAGMASALGLLISSMLTITRVPKVMADDKLFPALFCKIHPRWGSPYISIIAAGIVTSVMVLFNFSQLLIIDVSLYGSGLLLEFIALIALRRREPNLDRPYRIPLQISGLVLLTVLPVACLFYAVMAGYGDSSNSVIASLVALGGICSGVPAWMIFKKKAVEGGRFLQSHTN